MFESIILAGGFGTRLKSISGDTPKPMVKVGGSPFLYILMKNLEKQGCKNIIISTHYNSDFIIDSILKDNPVRCNVDFAIEEKPLGTGGAIKFASNKISSDKFIVLNGDTYNNIKYLEFLDYSRKTDILISAVKIANPDRFGIIELDSNKNVLSLNSSSKTFNGIINSGTYAIKKSTIQTFKKNMFSFEDDFLRDFKGTFKAHINNNTFIDIGIPEDYERACELFK